jgi:hypothetical protein
VALGKKLWGMLKGKGKGKEDPGKADSNDALTTEEKQAKLESAIKDSTALMKEESATPENVRAKLPGIKSKYGLKSLELVHSAGDKYHVDGKINPEMSSDDITLQQAENSEEWQQLWQAKQEEVNNVAQQFVPRFLALDPNAQVRMRGSLASGVKMNPSKVGPNGERLAFNPSSFDIDAYVVSDVLFEQAAENNPDAVRNGQIVGSKSNIRPVQQIIRDMREALANIPGNRDSGENRFRFNVVIRSSENARYTTNRDRRNVGALGLPRERGNPLVVQSPENEE